MADSPDRGAESRVLLLAPTKKDAKTSRTLLQQAGLTICLCDSLSQICEEIPRGTGVVIIPEEALLNGVATCFAELLREQPQWSDLPVLVLMSAGRTPSKIIQALLEMGDISLLKRPLDVAEFLSAVQAALRDRHRQYQVRDHLAEQNRQSQALRDADRRKDEFLAMLAHELRNPLAPIRNGLQILQLDPSTTPDNRRVHEMMDRQVQHLARLVDDLLDVSRITRGKAELRKERVDLNDVLLRAAEAARPYIDARRHHLTLQQPGYPVWAIVDLTRMTQVVGNLLNNSAKYSEPKARITISLDAQDDRAIIRVRDTGLGIPQEMLPRVFELFTQVDRTLDRSQGGLGIGLTLVRSLVEMHGGTVHAASDGLGKGSEFTVTIPIIPADPVEAQSAMREQNRCETKFKILVVDDHPDAGDSLAMLLRIAGHKVEVVQTGEKALSVAREFAPNVAVLDIGLPGMNGYELAARLRIEPYGASMLMIALTGYGQDDDRRRTREAGFDYHLTKPANPNELASLLARFSGADARS
jgi:signal transduction histidine kinase/ActR/RegA family two-component response regulator